MTSDAVLERAVRQSGSPWIHWDERFSQILVISWRRFGGCRCRTTAPDRARHGPFAVDGPVRGMAWLGLRHLRQPSLQLRRADVRAGAARDPVRHTRGRRGDAALDRHSHVAAADWVGGRRYRLRPHRRSPGPHAHPAADDGDVFGGDSGLRAGAEHLVARPLPASSRRSASGASGSAAPRWWPRPFRKTAASMPARCCIRQRRPVSFLATFIVYQIQGVYFRGAPEIAWRYVFLSGLIPAFVALGVRLMIKEPERWKHAIERARPGTISRAVLTGVPRADVQRRIDGDDQPARLVERERLHTRRRGRSRQPRVGRCVGHQRHRPGGAVESAGDQCVRCGRADRRAADHSRGETTSGAAKCSSSIFWAARCRSWPPSDCRSRRRCGSTCTSRSASTVWGITASFAFYLPELFPTRLRGTGAGFCFNLGRFVAAVGPFVVGGIAARGANALDSAMQALFYCGWIPILGLLLMPWVIETKNRTLPD